MIGIVFDSYLFRIWFVSSSCPGLGSCLGSCLVRIWFVSSSCLVRIWNLIWISDRVRVWVRVWLVCGFVSG